VKIFSCFSKVILPSIFLSFFLISCNSIQNINLKKIKDKQKYTTLFENNIEISYLSDGSFFDLQITLTEKVKIDLPGSVDIATSDAILNSKNLIRIFLEKIEKEDKEKFKQEITKTLAINSDINSKNSDEVFTRLAQNLKNQKKAILDSLSLKRKIYYRESKSITVILKTSNQLEKTFLTIKKILE